MNNTRPNLVVIMSDQHNARIMGCAGDPIVQTPHLDALAAAGVNFSRVYCPHPLCVPARAGFLTGQHPGEVNVVCNNSSLASDVPTFAHALGAAGYETVLCGRMHFYDPDQFHGFERRLVGDCETYLTQEIRGSGINRTNGQTRYAVEVSGYGRAGFEAFDEQVTREAIEFIQGRAAGDRPYCIVVSYMLPHNPFICNKELFDHYMAVLPELPPITADDWDQLNPAIQAWMVRRGVDKLTPEQHRRARAAYYGLVTTMDSNIGAVVEAVRASNTADNAAVLYLSDHGEQAGEHGMWWKSSFFEGSIRIPLIASWPGRFAAGVEADSVVNPIDLAPTLLDLAGAEPLPDASGHSLVPMMRTGRAPDGWKDEAFAEFSGAHGDEPSAMLLLWPWKLMYYPEFDTCLLFNLDEDRQEMNDLAGDPACVSIRDQLLARLKEQWSAKHLAKAAARAQRNRQTILSCGHELLPHELPEPKVPKDANQFDFTQLPHHEEICARRESGKP